MDTIKIVPCVDGDVEFIEKEIVNYNRKQVPFTQDTPFIDVNYKIEDTGKIVAGIRSTLYCWNCLFIDILFIDERYRNKGYGTALLKKVELEASKYNCHLIHLDTFDFQAKDFYLKNGFEIFGILPDCPKGHTRYYLKKVLGSNSTGEINKYNINLHQLQDKAFC